MEKLHQLSNTDAIDKPKSSKLTREMLYLAEQSAEGGIKVLPGKAWSLHYPVDSATRSERLQGLLTGKYKAEDVAGEIRPDALFYDVEDIEQEGLEVVMGRIKDLSSFITHYDYPRFAEFVESMRTHDIPLEDLDTLYSDLTQTRIQKKVIDSYGYTGRKQMEYALRGEAVEMMDKISGLSRPEKVLKALKINWLFENKGLVSMEERDRVVATLSGDERKLFEDLEGPYRQYIENGDEEQYEKLKKTIQQGLPTIQREIEKGGKSDSMQDLEKELEEFKDKTVPPGSPEDPAISPEDDDEYHTPPPPPGGGNNESKEKTRVRPIFEIEPPLGGYYISGRKSYYNIDTKTWSKRKQLTGYDIPLQHGDGSVLSGVYGPGLRSIPIPNGYAIDTSSLKTKGANVRISRDQNGCFYIDADGPGTFSVGFKKEGKTFVGQPVTQDTELLYRGSLSQKTETTISRLSGSPIQKAEQARQHILANHFYPGAGDLEMAQALQYKLRSTSTGDNYLQNLDASEYLECYSANTKFIAMMRKAGVPARLVVGHRVEGSKDGKSLITQNTGHAWSEIWDGAEWRRFDATPPAKPEDKKEDDNKDKEKMDPADEAEDGGVDGQPQQGGEGGEGGGKKGDKKSDKGGSGKPSDSNNPLDEMSDASDSEVSQAESAIDQAKKDMDKMDQQKQELDNKVDDADKFKDIADLKKRIEESEMFDDYKKDLQDKLDAKEEQMKDKIKEELDKMVEDGFMDEKKRDEIIKKLEEKALEEMDKVQRELEVENKLYNAYEDIRDEVRPLVEKWFEYFAERLPRHDEISFDRDSLTRQGSFDRRAVMRSRNLLFGTVKNPREIHSSVKPKFIASILVDVSGSMQGPKLMSARKLLVFYSELFSRIEEEFGYIRFSIDIFSDSVTSIKAFKQDYASPVRYNFDDGSNSTIKVRLMQKLVTAGGTNMLQGIKKAAEDLNEEVEEYPDHASALYFFGDGADTCGNTDNIKKFLSANESEHGFGEHMHSAVLLGNESQRSELAQVFGDEHTSVAPDFDELVEISMDKFGDDIEAYLKTKTT